MRRAIRSRHDLASALALPDAELDPAAALEAHALRDWVWGALDGLSQPLRHVVVLRYFSRANSYEAIAATLAIPVGTVRSRLSQARKVLGGSFRDLAAAAHADHRRVVQDRATLFLGIFEEYNRGVRCSLLRSALTDEAELRGAVGGDIRGRDLVAAGIETDIDAGVQFQILDLVAGSDIEYEPNPITPCRRGPGPTGRIRVVDVRLRRVRGQGPGGRDTDRPRPRPALGPVRPSSHADAVRRWPRRLERGRRYLGVWDAARRDRPGAASPTS